MRIVGVIPARYKSSRYPGKPLVPLLGKPMIIWVCEGAVGVFGRENLYVATEDERIRDVVETAGFRAIMTSDEHLTGTDRLSEVATKVEADIYVNIQGDEPLVNGDDIQKVISAKRLAPSHVVNAYASLAPDEDPSNVNIPKVVVSASGRLVYMSRLPIPGIKDSRVGAPTYRKQVCIYAFNADELVAFKGHGRKGSQELYEDIEILRFFDLGVPVQMVEVDSGYLAVDRPEDVVAVENALRARART